MKQLFHKLGHMNGAFCGKEEEADGSMGTCKAHSHADNCPVSR